MKILGIDMGSTSIKAVEIDSAFGRYEVQEYHEQVFEPGTPGDENQGWAAAHLLMENLTKSGQKLPDRVVVTLPSKFITSRNLQLPTKDRKAIQASVGFELEDDLPFNLSDAVYDYSIVSQSGNQSYVHVAATMHKHLVPFIEKWRSIGIDPDIITTPAWAYRTYFNRILGTSAVANRPILLVQIGHASTFFYLHWRGIPMLTREIQWGGRDITTALCRHLGMPIAQAEAKKTGEARLVPPSLRTKSDPSLLSLSDALELELSVLFRELKTIELSCKSLTHEKISKIYLSGGSSQIMGIDSFLSEILMLPVEKLQALSSVVTSGVTYSEAADTRFLNATAAAFTLVGSDRSQCLNLRRGAFSKVGAASDFNWETIKRPVISAAAIFTCLFVSLFVQKQITTSRITEVNSRLEKSAKSFFGSVSSSAIRGYLEKPATLKSAIQKELNKERELNRLTSSNTHSPLDFLKTLSGAITKDQVVDLTYYQVGASARQNYAATTDSRVSLTFLVASPQVAERLNNLLTNRLSGMEKSKLETIGTGPDARYKITFTGKPTEDSYVK